MKHKLLSAFLFVAALGQTAQAMPVGRFEPGAGVTLVRDGCGPGYFRGRHGDCYPERREPEWRPWERDRRPPPPREYYAPPREEGWRHERRVCPRGYHLGRQSGVCRPD